MKKEEEYQRRFLLDELSALSGYGHRSLGLPELETPAEVKRAQKIVGAWQERANKHRRKMDRLRAEELAEIRQAIAFRKYDDALRLIKALKKKASGK